MPWALMDGCSTPTLSHRPRWWTLWGPETPSTRPSSSACPRVSTPAGGPGLGPAPARKTRLIWLFIPPSREEHAGGTELWLPGGGQEVWSAGLRWHRVRALWQEAPAHTPPQASITGCRCPLFSGQLASGCLAPWADAGRGRAPPVTWHLTWQSCRANKSSPEPASFWQSVFDV